MVSAFCCFCAGELLVSLCLFSFSCASFVAISGTLGYSGRVLVSLKSKSSGNMRERIVFSSLPLSRKAIIGPEGKDDARLRVSSSMKHRALPGASGLCPPRLRPMGRNLAKQAACAVSQIWEVFGSGKSALQGQKW
jgi:hypothetical protein